MKATTIIALSAVLTTGMAWAETSGQTITQKVKEGCQKELSGFCKNVTPGEGRVYACLYAFSDKLSGRCEYALYDASKQLEDAVTKLNHVANSCADDMGRLCSDLRPGGGRIAGCLKKNMEKTSPSCQQAMKDTGMAGK